MFKKQFGYMTVNVQGLSRVSVVIANWDRADIQGMFILNALYFGAGGAKKNYALQIKTLVDKTRQKLGETPIVIGECGVPMDLK
jgi:hypothetical protein